MHGAYRPRHCVRCLKLKEPGCFPPHGRCQRLGITRVCWSCIEMAAWVLHDSDWKPRLKQDWIEDGVPMRRCTTCREGKPHDSEHFVREHRVCKACRYARNEKARKAQRAREGDRVKSMQAARARRRRLDPKVKRKENEACKRWREKAKSTPQGHAKLLETERMGRRLRAEREGKPVRRTPKAVMAETVGRFLPSAPLVALVDQIHERRLVVAGLLDDADGASVNEVCRDLDVSPRTVLRWRSGEAERVRIDVAERLLLAAGVEWHEVYPFDDYAEQFLALEMANDKA